MSDAFWGTISILWLMVSFIFTAYFAVKKNPSWRKGLISTGLSFAMLCWAISLPATPPLPKQTAAPVIEHDPLSAYVMAQDFVSSQLKAPSTAKFQSYSKDLVQDLGGGRYRISAYVDAQNSFGATMRNKFNCTVKYTGNNKWVSEEVELR